MTPRFIILNAILIAVLALLAIGGYLTDPFTSIAAPACWAVVVALCIGLFAVARNNREDAKEVAIHITKLSLIGACIGFIVALKHFGTSGGDIQASISGVATGMSLSLYATACGLISNIWLHINIRLLLGRGR